MSSPTSRRWHQFGLRFNNCGRSATWPKKHRLSREWFKGSLVDFTFWFFFDGHGELIDHRTGRTYPLHAGVCLCMKPGMDLEARQGDSELLGDAYFHVDLMEGGRRVKPDRWPDFPFYSEVTEISFFDQTTQRILALLDQSDRSDATTANEELLTAEYLFKGLMMDLFQTHRKLEMGGTPLHHERVISLALNALFADSRRFRSVAELAEYCGYSEGHFRSLCLKITGTPPSKLLIKARIEKAKKYLRYSDLSVSMIADALGYEHVYYFSRQFRMTTGMTAVDYRKRCRDTGERA